jgi:hypothetical protein
MIGQGSGNDVSDGAELSSGAIDRGRSHDQQCPTPQKREFRSAAEAKRFNRQYRSLSKARLWPYQCGDHWHLTTQNYDEQKRIGKRSPKRRLRHA